MNDDKLQRLLDIGIIIKVHNEEELKQLRKVMEGKISKSGRGYESQFFARLQSCSPAKIVQFI